MEEILADLEEFFISLPYNEGKRFNKEDFRFQFRSFINDLYIKTKDVRMSKKQCEDFIREKMEVTQEMGKLKFLQENMRKFVSSFEKLVRKHLEEARPSLPIDGSRALMPPPPPPAGRVFSRKKAEITADPYQTRITTIERDFSNFRKSAGGVKPTKLATRSQIPSTSKRKLTPNQLNMITSISNCCKNIRDNFCLGQYKLPSWIFPN
jgi:hypothetical protein